MDAKLERIFRDLGLDQYIPGFLSAGFTDFNSISYISEDDFANLNVSRGYRRKLQRAIATWYDWPKSKGLPTAAELQVHNRSTSKSEELDNLSSDYLPSGLICSPPGRSQGSSTEDTIMSVSYSNTDVQSLIIEILETGEVPASLSNNPIYFPDSSPPRIETVRSLGPSGSPNVIDELLASDLSTLKSFLEGFFQNLNHFLYFFNEFDLRQTFDEFFNPEIVPKNKEKEIEILLILALGAKYSGIPQDETSLRWYTKAQTRVIPLSERLLPYDLPLMRILMLLALYCIENSLKDARQFLDLAIRVGNANGLNEDLSLRGEQEPQRSHWCRVWETLIILDSWLLMCSQTSTTQLLSSNYFIDVETPLMNTEECYNGRLTQMSVKSLCSLLREILQDLHQSPESMPSLSRAYLESLDSWYSDLPIYLCLRPRNSPSWHTFYNGANERQKTCVLVLHTFFFGTLCHLLQPILFRSLQSSAEFDTIESTQYASRCVEAAGQIILLCKDMSESGYTLQKSWIASHFLFNAILILILEVTRARRSTIRFIPTTENISRILIAEGLMNQIAEMNTPWKSKCVLLSQFCKLIGISGGIRPSC